MHRIVIFSEPVVDNGEVLYGKLYSGETEDKLIASAAADLKRLLIQEQFVGHIIDTYSHITPAFPSTQRY